MHTHLITPHNTNNIVSIDDAKTFANSLDCRFMQTSARTGENVKEAMTIFAKQIYNRVMNANKLTLKRLTMPFYG